MALTMNELDARLRAVEERPVGTGDSDLEPRVARLEKALQGLLSGKVAEISQEEKDRRTLASLPNSFPQAVEYEAAKRRQADRDAQEHGVEPAGSEA